MNHYERAAELVRAWVRDNCPDVAEKESEDLVQRIAEMLKTVTTKMAAFE